MMLFHNQFQWLLCEINWQDASPFTAESLCSQSVLPSSAVCRNTRDGITGVSNRGETSINATEAKLLVFSASEGGSMLLRSQKVNMADKNDIDMLVFMWYNRSA